MQSRWNPADAAKFSDNLLALRAYTSRLLGQEPSLVQHGGGNTSVKLTCENIFGDKAEILFVKGSGWDLATIQPQGFAPVRMDVLLRMARLEKLSDADMVREQRTALIDPSAPTPSVEAILHAIIPFRFVEHTHSDAVVTLSNTPSGEQLVREALGDKIMVLPYTMPGFILARQIFEHTRDVNWQKIEGIVLLNHGIFTFHDDARMAYENMIRLVSKAEESLNKRKVTNIRTAVPKEIPSLKEMAELRRLFSKKMRKPALVRLNSSAEAVGFANWENAPDVSSRGTLTPDHVIHIKPKPAVLGVDLAKSLDDFEADYDAYFAKYKKTELKELDPCPRWALWPGRGSLSVATSPKSLRIVEDIMKHTLRCMQWGEALGGFRPVSEADLFEIEYWELEQAKLKTIGGLTIPLQGKIAVVTGAASGIGKAIALSLKEQGACVASLDLNPEIESMFDGDAELGIVCDVTRTESIEAALDKTARHFGGIDILVSNAGTFSQGKTVDEIAESEWNSGIDINLSSHWRVIKAAAPALKQGFDPSIIIIGSKNVSAPGPGAAVYSSAKAGLTQLARVAALELASFGIRVNTVHPDAVFDTGIWTKEAIASRARHYGLSVDQYKTKNLLKTEITSKNVADLVAVMVGPAFSKTTGAQIPIDGGSDRVI